jgi:hypothetical protein
VAEALSALRADGVQPTDAEIAWLARLRWPCDHPCDGSIPWVMGAPIVYGGVTFSPLHRLAESWLYRAYQVAIDGGDDRVWLYLYAHAHSGIGDVSLRGLMTSEAIIAAVDAWSKAQAIHAGQVNEICQRLMALDGHRNLVPDVGREADDADERDGAEDFAATMMRLFPGTTAEYWMVGIPAGAARNLLLAQESGPWAESGKRKAALENYQRAVRWVRLSHG